MHQPHFRLRCNDQGNWWFVCVTTTGDITVSDLYPDPATALEALRELTAQPPKQHDQD